MNITQIENNLKKLVREIDKSSFIYDLLLAYNLPKSSITRLQKGNLNLSKTEGEISWKKKLLFREVYDQDLHLAISDLVKEVKHDQRFVVVTDYKQLLAIDTKTQDKLDIELGELNKHYAFFLPWAGMEKAQHKNENPADVKAAEKMAKLFDEIKKDNPDTSPEFIHGLNVFLSRLLFCFFAEDTDIFEDNLFTNSVSSHTQPDGSDLGDYLDRLFEVLNTDKKDRKDIPEHLMDFPYVNGGLFKQPIKSPTFTRRSRQAIIESGELQWSEINPDIFGSMIQAVITPEHRGGLGMHYTSVPNIMKVIEPLFLNDLYEAYDKAKGSQKKLSELLRRISKIKIFDPACGSGNFLIIAYKELRRLEMKIFKENNLMALSGISLSQFYGIELDDFAHEIAQLSLWLAEHQMNVEFYKEFGRTNPTLPLKESGKIVHGNACRVDWEHVCPKNKEDETYLLGNPPYLGGRMQNSEQKEDIKLAYSQFKKAPKVDYISCWFLNGAKYIKNSRSYFAFVTTNSICQGEQINMIWPHLLEDLELEIFFAYKGFKWENNAKKNAGVIVSIIGLRNPSSQPKYIFEGNLQSKAQNINPYLIDGNNFFIEKRTTPISDLKRMEYGNMAIDGGHLILNKEEKLELINSNPSSEKYIRQIFGAQEYLNNVERYCLWIDDLEAKKALTITEIAKRVNAVQEKRASGNDKGVIELAKRPHQFREMKQAESFALILPTVSSERRNYLPIGFLKPDQIIIAPNQAIYDPETHLLGILSSKMHMVWLKTVGGRLKTDFRYSSSLVYNTFPFPNISEDKVSVLTQSVFRILEERERHSDKTLAQLYDPDKMPEGLREAHRLNDLAVERCYRSRPFESDEERLEYLFKLYEKMIEEEKQKNTLFDKKVKK
tara:strand:- start:45821 stop:48487 length:2667 start_codon:yes stop_codon:yes gene_type:complete